MTNRDITASRSAALHIAVLVVCGKLLHQAALDDVTTSTYGCQERVAGLVDGHTEGFDVVDPAVDDAKGKGDDDDDDADEAAPPAQRARKTGIHGLADFPGQNTQEGDVVVRVSECSNGKVRA